MKNFWQQRFWLSWVPSLLIAVLGFCAVLVQIDPAETFPAWPAGPGLTLDEGFNVEEGVRLAHGLKVWMAGAVTWREVFGGKKELGPNAPLGYHLADHPPGGRMWLGVWHQTLSAARPQPNGAPAIVVAYARIGSAAAFAALIFLIGTISTRWYGGGAGIISAASLIFMPRVFGHAHLAALETVMNLTYAAAILAVAGCWRREENSSINPAPNWKHAALAGVVWGLALLTKIQAVLIAPPVALWVVWHWRSRAVVPLVIWSTVGLAVFFVGWPWLWFDPWGHVVEYFRRSTHRSTLYVWYLGERFADVHTPWHYPFVLFLTVVPVGLLLWGVCGVGGRDDQKKLHLRDGKFQLILAAAVFPLIVFAIPGVAVYDGARLFLASFPLWSIAVGRGVAGTWRWFQNRAGVKIATAAFAGIFLLQSYGFWAMSPCSLSYYNLLLGGLPGAERLGMEMDYWGESLTRELWDEVLETVPKDSVVHVTPVLHPLQLVFLESQHPELRQRGIRLQPCIPERTREAKYLLVFRREADLAPPIQNRIAHACPKAEVSRQGVRLGAFYVFPTDHGPRTSGVGCRVPRLGL